MLSVMAGSRYPMYSPLLNVMCLFVQLDTKTLTDVFPFMLCMPLMMFMLGSLPFLES